MSPYIMIAYARGVVPGTQMHRRANACVAQTMVQLGHFLQRPEDQCTSLQAPSTMRCPAGLRCRLRITCGGASRSTHSAGSLCICHVTRSPAASDTSGPTCQLRHDDCRPGSGAVRHIDRELGRGASSSLTAFETHPSECQASQGVFELSHQSLQGIHWDILSPCMLLRCMCTCCVMQGQLSMLFHLPLSPGQM